MTIQKNINGMNKKLIFDSVERTLKQQNFDTIQKQNIKNYNGVVKVRETYVPHKIPNNSFINNS